jgi:hypothetical protein
MEMAASPKSAKNSDKLLIDAGKSFLKFLPLDLCDLNSLA